MKKRIRDWILTGLLVSTIVIVFSASANVALAQPVIDFVSPTPPDDSEISVNHLVINATVTSTENVSTLILNWNGTNHTMFCSGNISIDKPYEIYGNLSRSGLQDGLFVYKVYANDTDGNWNVSETRVVTVNVTAIPGDITGDSKVDWEDFLILADAYDTVSGDPNYNVLVDIHPDTPDGDVDWEDFLLFADWYGYAT